MIATAAPSRRAAVKRQWWKASPIFKIGEKVRAIGKADLAECCVALRYTGAKAQHAATPSPGRSHVTGGLAHGHRHFARWAGSRQGTKSLKNTMIPSPENWSSVPSNWLTSGPQSAMILAQEIQHFLGLSRLGERRCNRAYMRSAAARFRGSGGHNDGPGSQMRDGPVAVSVLLPAMGYENPLAAKKGYFPSKCKSLATI